ncbi:MAG: hypothetical protein QF731_09570 [Verrucomicrobiota bacterium]|nr:hypothetical protein [Verrucomicrobiota bacterium]
MTAIFPMGCKVGGEVEVKVYGSDLEGATGLYFSRAGISGKLLNSSEQKFQVKVASAVPPGVYEVRFVGALGVSNPRPFVVGTINELFSTGDNDSIEKAFPITRQSLVNASVLARKSQWFRLKCDQNQRILLRLTAASLDSKLDPIMVLRNKEGDRLARADGKGLIDYTQSTAGDLYLQIHDSSFAGGVEYFFRVENITNVAHVDFVYPSVVPNSEESQVTLYGRNLPGSELSLFNGADGRQLERLVVKLGDLMRSDLPGGLSLPPASIVLEGGAYRLPGANHHSNPFFLTHANEQSIIKEDEKKSGLHVSQLVPSLGVVAGRFYPERDIDSFRFTIKKGKSYQLDLFSQRLGFNTHPYVTTQIVNVSDGKEVPGEVKEFYESKENLGGREFNMTNRDVTWRFQAKSDGYLRVVLRDLFNQVSDGFFKSYVLTMRRQVPGFRLVVHPQTIPIDKNKRNIELMTTHLRKGGCLPIRIVAIRQGAFTDPIRVVAEGLPKGVSLESAEFKKGQNSITAFLVATDSVEAFTGDIKFLGLAEIEGNEIEVLAETSVTRHRVADYNNEPVLARLTTATVLSVNENDPEPVKISTGKNTVFRGEADGKIIIPLNVERHGEFVANFKLKAFGITQLDKLGELEVKKDQNKTSLEIDLAKFKVPVGVHNFNLASTVKGKYQYPPLNGEKSSKKKDVTYRFFTPSIVLNVVPASAPEK